MSWLTTRDAPPDVLPDTMRIASPSDWAKALIAGFGPMKDMSSAPANNASTASGPALNVLGSSFVSPSFCSNSPCSTADDGRRVRDVGEVSEPDRFGGGVTGGPGPGGGRSAGARVALVVAATSHPDQQRHQQEQGRAQSTIGRTLGVRHEQTSSSEPRKTDFRLKHSDL